MGRFRLSIFSFETLRLKAVPLEWWLSLALGSALLLGVEGAARYLMRPLGEYAWAYWDDQAMVKFEWFRAVASAGSPPEVLVIGDSTGARDFCPKAFTETSGGLTAFNLAWPANFPFALEATTLPFLRDNTLKAPRYVVLFQSPAAFVDSADVERFEAGILSSPIARLARGDVWPVDRVALARIYRCRHLLVRYWLRGEPPITSPTRDGFMPERGTGRTGQGNDKKPVEVPLSKRRLDVVRKFAQVARERGTQLIVVVPPVRVRPVPSLFQKYRRWLENTAGSEMFRVIDCAELPELGEADYKDFIHLNERGAERFSAILGRVFADGIATCSPASGPAQGS
ncbi:hypothetical protein [Deferrisoma camini]|uniref:hypothetical protein n=1 Tax=Deferrisoma camini TaxID=1035120 RepID=UPI00146A5B0E|nr:hypothetical protein [Deferrisoma camini]